MNIKNNSSRNEIESDNSLRHKIKPNIALKTLTYFSWHELIMAMSWLEAGTKQIKVDIDGWTARLMA